jgi:hypothetical protein
MKQTSEYDLLNPLQLLWICQCSLLLTRAPTSSVWEIRVDEVNELFGFGGLAFRVCNGD